MVKRLAPEVNVVNRPCGHISGPVHFAVPAGVDSECCSLTFHSLLDAEIPELEKSLTLYLWRVHFPERYERRPNLTGWGQYMIEPEDIVPARQENPVPPAAAAQVTNNAQGQMVTTTNANAFEQLTGISNQIFYHQHIFYRLVR